MRLAYIRAYIYIGCNTVSSRILSIIGLFIFCLSLCIAVLAVLFVVGPFCCCCCCPWQAISTPRVEGDKPSRNCFRDATETVVNFPLRLWPLPNGIFLTFLNINNKPFWIDLLLPRFRQLAVSSKRQPEFKKIYFSLDYCTFIWCL